MIESRLDIGRGPVATVLIHRGTLRVGDAAVAGDAAGKVRALYDYRGEKVKEAKPGDPVEILGFDHPPTAGEFVRVVEHERQAKHLANVRAERLRREQFAQRPRRRVSLESFHGDLLAGEIQDLNIVLKGDVQGSVEALLSELQKIQHSEVRVQVIHTGVGGITENDVNLASASDALVIGFNVRPSADARVLAEREGVDIRTYRVIYQLTDDIEKALVGMLTPVQTEETLGEAEVRALFKVSRLGTIAGCMVTTGVVRRGAQVRVVRDGTVIYETSIAQLKRFKDDAREVAEGFECGILLDGFNDVKEGDILEAYETRQVERTDLDEPAPVAPPRRPTTPRRGGNRHGRLRRNSLRRAALPRERVAEREAQVREVREGAAARALRRHGGGGRAPRALAARGADGRMCGEGASRAPAAARRGRALSRDRRSSSSCARIERSWSPVSNGGRKRRVNEAIRQVLSDTIPTLKDPRIGFVTITGVEAATGYAHATVYRERLRHGGAA